MSFIHITTEIKGGAGEFVANLHQTMVNSGLPSKLLTRERGNISGLYTIKPKSRISLLSRSLRLSLLSKVGIINDRYAIFGIEKSPVDSKMISNALASNIPKALIFYWISYFVNLQTILDLKKKYSNVPIVFLCLDEAFLTGACHYSMECNGYQKTCSQCPATSSKALQKRIEDNLKLKQDLISKIDPTIIYPTSAMKTKGEKSSLLKKLRSKIIPLGAVNNFEISLFKDSISKALDIPNDNFKSKTTLLVRSSSEHRKGYDLFVAAIKILHQQIPNLRHTLRVISIGDETLNKSSISRYVDHEFKGIINRNTLISLYSQIDVFLVTSREDAGPIMVNESIALGVFVISTPVGVSKDLITSDRIGLITRNINAESIADSIKAFIKQQQVNNIDGKLKSKNKINYSLTFESYINSLKGVIEADNNL